MVTKSFVPCYKSSEPEGWRVVGSQEDGRGRVRLACSVGLGRGSGEGIPLNLLKIPLNYCGGSYCRP